MSPANHVETIHHAARRSAILSLKPIREIRITFDEDRNSNVPTNVIVHYFNGTSVEALDIETWNLQWEIPPYDFTEFETGFACANGLGLLVNVTMANQRGGGR